MKKTTPKKDKSIRYRCLTLLLRRSQSEDTSLNETLNLFTEKTLKKD